MSRKRTGKEECSKEIFAQIFKYEWRNKSNLVRRIYFFFYVAIIVNIFECILIIIMITDISIVYFIFHML